MDASRLSHHRGGTGPPLLLMHGIGSSWRAWKPVLPALETARDVLALDLPGFGGSPPLPPATPPTVAALADAVEGEMDAAGWRRAHLAGNSLGGWVALELARRGRALTTVALSPAGLASPRERAYITGSLRFRHGVARRLAPAADVLMAVPPLKWLYLSQSVARPWRVSRRDAAGGMRALAGAPGFLSTLEHTLERQAEGLENIESPVLVAWGSRDRLLVPRQGPRFERIIPGAELRPLRGLGHVPMSDDPPTVAGTILGMSARHGEAG